MLGSTFVISFPQNEMSGKFSMHQELISEQMLFLCLEEMYWRTTHRSRGLQSVPLIPALPGSKSSQSPKSCTKCFMVLKVKWKSLHLSRPVLADEITRHTKARSGTPCPANTSCCSQGNPAQALRDWTQPLAGNRGGFEFCYKRWFVFESRHAPIHDLGY